MKNFILSFILIGAIIGAYYFGLTYVTGAQSLAIYTIVILTIGIIFGTVRNAIYTGLRYNALKREQEKNSISSTESQAKVKVLEAKIQTLEKALENALKSK